MLQKHTEFSSDFENEATSSQYSTRFVLYAFSCRYENLLFFEGTLLFNSLERLVITYKLRLPLPSLNANHERQQRKWSTGLIGDDASDYIRLGSKATSLDAKFNT